MGKELFKYVDRNRAKELLKVTDMNQAKEFAEVLKVVALEYDLEYSLPKSDYKGYSILAFFVEKYIKEPLGFNEEEWNNELVKIAKARLEEKNLTLLEIAKLKNLGLV